MPPPTIRVCKDESHRCQNVTPFLDNNPNLWIATNRSPHSTIMPKKNTVDYEYPFVNTH